MKVEVTEELREEIYTIRGMLKVIGDIYDETEVIHEVVDRYESMINILFSSSVN